MPPDPLASPCMLIEFWTFRGPTSFVQPCMPDLEPHLEKSGYEPAAVFEVFVSANNNKRQITFYVMHDD